MSTPARTEFRIVSGSDSNTAVSKPVEANPPHGSRGDFRKVTVTLPPEIYRMLVEESARRKIASEPNHLLAAILREAVLEYLSKR